MTRGVFMHKADSIYDDIPAMYLIRAEPCIGDWIVYLKLRKVRNSRGRMDPRIPEGIADGAECTRQG